MMTAIRSFVNDWVSQNSTHNELGEIEYGGNKIIIEASGYSYLAVIVEGSAYKVTYDKIRKTLEEIVLDHGESIRNFNGDLEKFENIEIYRKIGLLLQDSTTKPKKTKIHPLLFLIPLLLFSWGVYSYYKTYEKNKVQEKVMQRLYKTPQLTSYRIDANFNDGVVTLSGEVPFTYHKQLASKSISNIEGVSGVTNNLLVIESFKDPMQISANIAYLIKGLNHSEAISLRYSYDFTTLLLEGSVWDKEYLKEVQTVFEGLKEVQNIEYKISITPPPLYANIYFNKGSVELTQEAQTTLINVITLLKKLDKETSITLSAYSDLIGSQKHNQRLSQKRVSQVLLFLQNKGELKQKFSTKIFNKAPEDINITKEPQKARTVLIHYTSESL
ncbi:MAG: BON domain-containing protein [Sulfurimonas sp.]|nr:BON domain-containing protein [Sulfurimonas sp.]